MQALGGGREACAQRTRIGAAAAATTPASGPERLAALWPVRDSGPQRNQAAQGGAAAAKGGETGRASGRAEPPEAAARAGGERRAGGGGTGEREARGRQPPSGEREARGRSPLHIPAAAVPHPVYHYLILGHYVVKAPWPDQ